MEAADYFRAQANECRALAGASGAPADREALLMLARHYDREARRAAEDPGPGLNRPSLQAH